MASMGFHAFNISSKELANNTEGVGGILVGAHNTGVLGAGIGTAHSEKMGS